MAKTFNQHMREIQGTDEVKQNNKCWHDGCPMKADGVVGGSKECVFHFGQEGRYHKDITNAIKGNIDLIKNYNKLLKHEDWSNPAMIKWMKENTLCPAHVYEINGEEVVEPVSIYLSRYFDWMVKYILDEATNF